MKIVKLSIENFKMFKEKKEFDFSDMNFLIGENNTGKTTIIEAVDYLINGPKKDFKYKNLNMEEGDFITVEIVIMGDFSSIDAKYKDYIYTVDDVEYIKIKRSDENKTIIQNGKNVELNQSKILFYKESISDYENPSGKDTTFNVLEPVFIFARQNINEIVSFDSTKILGKLIKANSQDFFTSPGYKEFAEKHNEVFIKSEDSLQNRLENLSKNISEILKEQWGDVEFKFNFELVDPSSHLKNGNLFVKENGKEHELDYKGSGMQRSTMLALIQLFSNVSNNIENSNLILCIDEPELNLHPKAQEKLIKALHGISDKIQIIISTHSPHVLKSFNKPKDKIYIFNNKSEINFNELKEISILSFGPTLAEIQFFAYNMLSTDLHNELYSYIEYKDKSKLANFIANKKYKKLKEDGTAGKEELVSLQTFIRHLIHHPENKDNTVTGNFNFTEIDLENSCNEMISTIKNNSI